MVSKKQRRNPDQTRRLADEKINRDIDDRNRGNKESSNALLAVLKCLAPLTPCLYCCFGLLTVTGVIATGMLFWGRYFGNETIFSNHTDIRAVKIFRANATSSKNLTENLDENEQLCNAITNKEAPETIDSPNYIYIVKGDQNISNGQACGVESLLRIFPDKTVYLIDFNKQERMDFNRCDSQPNYLGLLQCLYKDRLQLVFADKAVFFKNTPLQEVTKTGKNLEFFAMLLAAYKYGGFVATPAVIMTSRELLECFPEETIIEPFVILTSKKCDGFLYYLMEIFKLCDDHFTTCFNETLTQAAELYSRDQVIKKFTARRLAPTEVSSSVNSPCVFLKIQEFKNGNNKWMSEISNFCKQVVQTYLGIAINLMEVEQETKQMKTRIKENAGKISCGMSTKEEEESLM